MRYRNFQLYFGGQLISNIGTWMQIIAQAWVVYQIGHSELVLGLVAFASAIPTLLISPWGGVVVDRFCRSSVGNIYAVGDVTHRLALTPVAIREGAAVATTLFGGLQTPVDHNDVPSAVFSQPPVGTVGLTESEAAAKLGKVDIYKASFRPLRHTLSGRDERTLVKLVVDSTTQRVVGAHMVGADAPEIIQGIALAVKAGLTKAQFDQTVGIHPTAAEEFVTLREKFSAS